MSTNTVSARALEEVPLQRLTDDRLQSAGVSEPLKFVQWLAKNEYLHCDDWLRSVTYYDSTKVYSAGSIADQLGEWNVAKVEDLRNEYKQPKTSSTSSGARWVELTWDEWEGSSWGAKWSRGGFVEHAELGVIVGERFFSANSTKLLSGGHIKEIRGLPCRPKTLTNSNLRGIASRAPSKARFAVLDGVSSISPARPVEAAKPSKAAKPGASHPPALTRKERNLAKVFDNLVEIADSDGVVWDLQAERFTSNRFSLAKIEDGLAQLYAAGRITKIEGTSCVRINALAL